jgi:hypothetical protein
MAPDDAIKAAASVARDAAEGRLSPAALQEQAVAECRELFGTVAGPGDALWELQVKVARCFGAEGNFCRRADRVAGCGAPAHTIDRVAQDEAPLRATNRLDARLSRVRNRPNAWRQR